MLEHAWWLSMMPAATSSARIRPTNSSNSMESRLNFSSTAAALTRDACGVLGSAISLASVPIAIGA